MKLRLISAAFAISLLPAAANAQVTVDMGALTCEQYLAMSPSMSRDFSAWVSGWYSYQDAQESCGCACAPEKHRKPEIAVPIPSAQKA